MREIWMMQPRFEKRVGSSPFSLAEQPRFRAGFDFLRLRADAGEVSDVLAAWWEDFSLVDDAGREDLVRQAREEHRPSSGPTRVHARAHGTGEAAGSGAHDAPVSQAVPAPSDPYAGEAGQESAAPRKRRRRRKPGAARNLSEGPPASGAGD
jgi:poly(A) polymerase